MRAPLPPPDRGLPSCPSPPAANAGQGAERPGRGPPAAAWSARGVLRLRGVRRRREPARWHGALRCRPCGRCCRPLPGSACWSGVPRQRPGRRSRRSARREACCRFSLPVRPWPPPRRECCGRVRELAIAAGRFRVLCQAQARRAGRGTGHRAPKPSRPFLSSAPLRMSCEWQLFAGHGRPCGTHPHCAELKACPSLSEEPAERIHRRWPPQRHLE